MLDEADRLGIPTTHISLQKLLYFAHGIYLIQTKSPLVSGYFEAWELGPVHPSVYRAFKATGSVPIMFRAQAQDLLTGERRAIQKPNDPAITGLIQQVLNSYGRLSPGRLVDLSHAKNSPWAHVVDKARTDVALGLRITDANIMERFRHHKVSIGSQPRSGDPSEDTPFA